MSKIDYTNPLRSLSRILLLILVLAIILIMPRLELICRDFRTPENHSCRPLPPRWLRHLL
jgi:hypothetical protein